MSAISYDLSADNLIPCPAGPYPTERSDRDVVPFGPIRNLRPSCLDLSQNSVRADGYQIKLCCGWWYDGCDDAE